MSFYLLEDLKEQLGLIVKADGLKAERRKVAMKIENTNISENKLKMNIQMLASNEQQTSAENNNQIDNTENELNNHIKENITKESTETNTEIEKKFSQSDIDNIITKRLERESKKWEKTYTEKLEAEKQEADRLAKMSAEEREKAKFEKERKEFEETKRNFELERLKNSTLQELSVRKLDANFVDFVIGEDADEIKAKLDTLEKFINETVENKVLERLKGGSTVPKTSTVSQTGAITLDEVKKMTPEEINKNWDKISKMQFNG